MSGCNVVNSATGNNGTQLIFCPYQKIVNFLYFQCLTVWLPVVNSDNNVNLGGREASVYVSMMCIRVCLCQHYSQ